VAHFFLLVSRSGIAENTRMYVVKQRVAYIDTYLSNGRHLIGGSGTLY